jgi:hypothetical protein
MRSILVAAAMFVGARAQAQIPVFSISWNGPSISLIDSFTGTPITEGDLLIPQTFTPQLGPLPTPGIVTSAGFLAPAGLGLSTHAPCVGHPPYTPCLVEVDALSHGLDALIQCIPGGPTHHEWAFSVSRRGIGIPGSPFPPAVWTEAPCQDEDADVYEDIGLPCGPYGLVLASGAGHTAYIDGNGLPNCMGGGAYPGTGLIENPPPTIPGDDLDALDDDVPDPYLSQTTCTFFSLDSGFVDPLTGFPNSGSAAANAFVGGDVLRSCPGCSPAVYAPAWMLGLDLGGSDTDDLDALALRENGIAGYQRSVTAYDWVSGGTDMLFFSVRRGSAVVGVPDSLFGLPIEPGDILVPPAAIGAPPGIWMRAENIGLSTNRGITPWIGDDLDALDTLQEPRTGTGFCGASTATLPCPCLNNGAPGRGCGNSVNSLGALLWANGLASISNDTVHFTASGMLGTATVILVQGTAQSSGVLAADGVRCIGGSLRRLYVRSSLCGSREFGYGVPGDQLVSVRGLITSPGTFYYQAQYRDPTTGYCTAAVANWTSAVALVWVP